MKQIKLLILSLVFISMLCSCTTINVGLVDKIQPPQNKIIPISGVWLIKSYEKKGQNPLEDQIEKLIGEKLIFDIKIAVIADEYSYYPIYKVKTVNLSDYLLYHYNIDVSDLNIPNQMVEVITITSENKYFYDLIKIKDNEAIINIDGTFLYLERLSEDVDDLYIEKYFNEEERPIDRSGVKDEINISSGLLLGLKSYKPCKNKEGLKEPSYRTIWISDKNLSSKDSYESKGLFVPRKSGFWKVEADDGQVDGIETLIIKNMNLDDPIQSFAKNKLQVLYVGNDYISVEYEEDIQDEGDKSTYKENIIKLLPLDNIQSDKAVKITDIAGITAKEMLDESISGHLMTNYPNTNKPLNITPDEESFTLRRRNGHWIMRGRLNLQAYGGNDIDYNIKIVPPPTLVSYDELSISWNAIKLQVAETIDAYTSPDNNMAILLSNNNILIYKIKNNKLSNLPSKKIKLKDEEIVVMAEWAQGKYTDKWEKEFMKNEVIKQ